MRTVAKDDRETGKGIGVPGIEPTTVYAIIDICRDGAVRYVGRTTRTLSYRLKQHKSQKSLVGEWIRQNPNCFQIVPLERVPFEPWAAGAAEWKWIRHYRKLGHQLFNVFPKEKVESEA